VFNETYSKLRFLKHLSDAFLVQSGLKERHTFSPLFFQLFSVEYAIS
jgi:hypothetical protein